MTDKVGNFKILGDIYVVTYFILQATNLLYLRLQATPYGDICLNCRTQSLALILMENTKLPVKTYSNITEFLLFFVRERPGMYLGEPKLSKLQNFIIGYQIGFSINNVEDDYYFGDEGFFEWYCNKYNKGPYSFWDTPFMEEAKDDDKKALQIYFKYLLEFYSERNQ